MFRDVVIFAMGALSALLISPRYSGTREKRLVLTPGKSRYCFPAHHAIISALSSDWTQPGPIWPLTRCPLPLPAEKPKAEGPPRGFAFHADGDIEFFPAPDRDYAVQIQYCQKR